MKKPLIYSLISGFVWMTVAGVLGYLVSPIHTTLFDVVRTFAGGIVVAPAVGLLVGRIAKRFSHVGYAQRFWLALGDLYLGAYIFLLATSVGRLVMDPVTHGDGAALQRALVVDPVLGTLLGLTYTGFVLALFPLSYLNHALIGKAWDQATMVRQAS